jgi:drug/metabolite transporter (DMT)-like permease
VKSRFSVQLVLVLGVLAISGAAILIRKAEAEPIAIAFYRMLFAAVMLLPLALHDLTHTKVTWQAVGALALAGFFLALHFALWNTSLDYTSVTSSVVLVTTQPVFVTILGALLLKEIPTRRAWYGLALALAGSTLIALVGSTGDASRLAGNAMALAGAVMAAGYFLVGRVARRTLPIGLYAASAYAFSALFLLLFALILKQPLAGYTKETWWSLVLLALVPTVFGHTSLSWALKYLPTAMVSVSILGEPLGATILAMIVLKEMPVLGEILGSCLILAGIFLIWKFGSTEEVEEDQAGGTIETCSETVTPS